MYLVTIDNFSGPLDLLLHLLKKDDVKIEDINIEKITKQYLDYIKQMENLNLDIASEYLVTASELIEMKSKILLPHTEEVEEEKEDFISRLIEYKNYKEITERLKQLEQERAKIYTKSPSIIEEETEEEKHEPIDVLLEAFKNLLEKQELEKPLDTKIAIKEYSVSERSKEIKNILKKSKKIEFTKLFTVFTKDYVVVTFLSILELARKQEVSIEQEKNFNEIYITNKEK